MVGGVVRQSHASLINLALGAGDAGPACGLLECSFGCGGPTLASELGQSQLPDVLTETRVQRELLDYSNASQTVSNAIIRCRLAPGSSYLLLRWEGVSYANFCKNSGLLFFGICILVRRFFGKFRSS